jgi:hypothetical protein
MKYVFLTLALIHAALVAGSAVALVTAAQPAFLWLLLTLNAWMGYRRLLDYTTRRNDDLPEPDKDA